MPVAARRRVPADDLPELNRNVVGLIQVVSEFR